MDNDDLDVFLEESANIDEQNENQLSTEEAPKDATGTPIEAPASKEENKENEGDGQGSDNGEEEEKPKTTEPPESAEKKSEEPELPKEAPAPLTKDDIKSVIDDIRYQERNSGKEIEDLTSEIMKTYYPDGLSNVLVDNNTGKELRTPQDVVDATNGSMTINEASQWLINKQYKLDQDINRIKDQAKGLAETNANFRSGGERVLSKYQKVFEKFPDVQHKVYKAYMKQVKMDNKNQDLILDAPDIEEFYDLVMEPYVLAYGHTKAQAPPTPTAQAPAVDTPQIPESRQTVDDRLDEGGDVGGGGKREADPNNPAEVLDELFGNG